jgi:hypothetical protein
MIKHFNELNEHTKHALDTASTVTVVGALMNWIPAVAGLITIVWYSIRIYETATVQNWIKKLRSKNAKQV